MKAVAFRLEPFTFRLAISQGGVAVTLAEALLRLRSEDADARRGAARALGRSGSSLAIAPLVGALKDPDRAVCAAAAEALWSLWMRSGDPETDAHLREGTRRMEAGDHAGAITCFSRVIARTPDFAEGYNKRATARYLRGAYAQSIHDCQETLRRNPVHFGALSGAGLCFMALGWSSRARRYFQAALALYPDLPGVRQNLAHLDRLDRLQTN